MSDRAASDNLPINAVLDDLKLVLRRRRRAVVAAPAGAGKTTMVPLALLAEPWLDGRRIVMLEPRRVAARAAARRMAELLGEEVGATVGYQTRDERRIGPGTRIEVVTEGILTRRLQNDPSLEGTGVVIFDEIHERNVPTDLGMAFLLDSVNTLGSDLRIVAMSATVDEESFARLLADDAGPAPVVASDGRMHPVDVRYLPRRRDTRLENDVADAVATALRDDEGDILVFLPGIGEINRVADVLATRVTPAVDVMKLAGALSVAEQDAALHGAAPGRRRVILSTDIAETSLTVEGVRVVVDAGLARVPRLDLRTGLTELVTVTSSRASADQRSGRAGRTEPGVAYRLWGRIEDSTRLAHLPAEITQIDLCGVALDIAAWGTRVANLSFCDPPPERAMQRATDTLRMLHLVDDAGSVTALGRDVLGLPLHPRLGTMVVRNRHIAPHGRIATIVAALLEERDIMRGRPDTLPVDLGLRVKAVAGVSSHDAVDRGSLHRVRDLSREIARRAGVDVNVDVSAADVDHLCGEILLAAYPDRLAKRRTSPGQFVMRGGGDARCDPKDAVAREDFVVAADVDQRRGVAYLRRAAAVDLAAIAPVLGDDVEVMSHLVWDQGRDDLVMRVVRKVGSMRLDERDLSPVAGEETARELLARVRATTFAVLGGGPAIQMRHRVAFLRQHRGDGWPDFSNAHLLASMDDWLMPYLAGATSRRDLAAVDMEMVLQTMLGWDRSAALDALAPARFQPPHGRAVDINYADPEAPTISVRVQHMFGLRTHPSVLDGTVPLRVQLLSPADRPIQVTADIPGFWSGSWSEVRKEMAGRYPKHDWPLDPSA